MAVVWFRVVPEVRSAARNFDGVRPWLVVAGVALQVTAWATYSVLTRAGLRNPRAVSLGRLARIQVTTQAVGNTVPGASAVGPALTHRMLARSGVASGDAAVALGTATFTSAIALNAILALALLVSIPFRGVNGPYLAAALTGAATILAMGGVLVAVARQAGWTLRTAAWVARRVRRDPVAAELAVMVAGDRLAAIAADRALLRRLASWAVVNWLLDAASLWCFLAAFGHAPGIDGLLVAFGVANVLAAVPVSPGGAGVVEWAYLTTLSGFGAAGGGRVTRRRRLPRRPGAAADGRRRRLLRQPGPRPVGRDRSARRCGWRQRRRAGDHLGGGCLDQDLRAAPPRAAARSGRSSGSKPCPGRASDVTAPRLPVPLAAVRRGVGVQQIDPLLVVGATLRSPRRLPAPSVL